MSKRARVNSQAQRRLAEVQRQQQTRQRRIRVAIGAGVLMAVLAVVAVLLVSTGGGAPAGSAGAAPAQGATVDGIQCQTEEQAVYHIHAHLAIYVNGSQEIVPGGVGIPGPQQVTDGFVEGGKCFYWLHTHDDTGVIHIESPSQRLYTLGQFFDIWGKKLSSTQVGGAAGTVTAFVNGKRVTGHPRSIRLDAHQLIQLDVGKAVPPQPYTFAAGL